MTGEQPHQPESWHAPNPVNEHFYSLGVYMRDTSIEHISDLTVVDNPDAIEQAHKLLKGSYSSLLAIHLMPSMDLMPDLARRLEHSQAHLDSALAQTGLAFEYGDASIRPDIVDFDIFTAALEQIQPEFDPERQEAIAFGLNAIASRLTSQLATATLAGKREAVREILGSHASPWVVASIHKAPDEASLHAAANVDAYIPQITEKLQTLGAALAPEHALRLYGAANQEGLTVHWGLLEAVGALDVHEFFYNYIDGECLPMFGEVVMDIRERIGNDSPFLQELRRSLDIAIATAHQRIQDDRNSSNIPRVEFANDAQAAVEAITVTINQLLPPTPA
jgi:hypothetical protein